MWFLSLKWCYETIFSGELQAPKSRIPNTLTHSRGVPWKVQDKLQKYNSMCSGHLGLIDVTSHRIGLVPDANYARQMPYRTGSTAHSYISGEVQRLLNADVIVSARLVLAAPVFFVPKPDGSLRICVDNRNLNSMPIKDTHSLLQMNDYYNSLGDACIFSTLHTNWWYWQIPVQNED